MGIWFYGIYGESCGRISQGAGSEAVGVCVWIVRLIMECVWVIGRVLRVLVFLNVVRTSLMVGHNEV